MCSIGIVCPAFVGNFIIERLHSKNRIPMFLNVEQDPFPRLQEVRMEEGDVLLVSPPKTGKFSCFFFKSSMRYSFGVRLKIHNAINSSLIQNSLFDL